MMKLSAFALLLSIALTGPALAADPPGEPAAQPATTESVVSGQASGLVVHWDAENQTYRQPTAEERAKIIDEMNRLLTARFADNKGMTVDTDAVVVETLPTGARRARLPLSFLNMAVVRVAPDGSFAPACTPSPERAGELLHTPVQPTGPTLEVQ
jgi:hypothetical protein